MYKLIQSHQAEALVIMCMDFRFVEATSSFLRKELKLSQFDMVSLAGGSKSIVDPLEDEDQTALFEQISLSVQLHKTPRIILVDHADCGAYGGQKVFGTLGKERVIHCGNMSKAKEFISAKFPGLEVDLVYANIEGDTIVFETVA